MGADGVPGEAVPEGVAFEVERFAWREDGRLEVRGRWFGLRGHRFVRPALTVGEGDDRRRILADLEHKPWAAEDGEEWVAAFAWEGERIALKGAELAVAPTLAVDLPAPSGPGRSRKAKAEADTEGPRPARRPPPKRSGRAAPKRRPAAPKPQPPAPTPAAAADRAAVVRLEAELADAHAVIRRLQAELDHSEAAAERSRVERDEARAARDAAVAAARDLEGELDVAVAAARDRERERDEVDDRLAAVTEERDAAREATPASVRRPTASREGARPSALVLWTQRLVAFAALVALAFVVYTLLHSVL
jgi:hypothetical protein